MKRYSRYSRGFILLKNIQEQVLDYPYVKKYLNPGAGRSVLRARSDRVPLSYLKFQKILVQSTRSLICYPTIIIRLQRAY
jgi:hypothetical protein